jgi:hypothetical protein
MAADLTAQVALAVALDTTAIGSLFYKRNLSYNLNSFFNVVDVAVFATGLAGWLWIAFADFNMEYAPPIMPYDGPENICAGLLIAIWYVPADCPLKSRYQT